MAKYSNTVEYNIRTNLDASGIAKLQTQLRQVEAELQKLQGRGVYTKKQVDQDLANIKQIQTALQKAFNPSLGMLDNKAFVSELAKGGKNLQDYVNTFNAAGTKGVQAFASWYGQIGKIDTGLKQISSTTDKIFNTLGNTVRWGLIASGFASVMNAAHESVQYVKELDESLTNIMMVTDYSKDAMNEYAKTANEVAKALGSTTTAMTNATLVFAQQGFDLSTSQQLAETSTKLANISQQDTATASDEITAYMNAFNLQSIDEINNAMSKWAKVANISAADVEELSVASQKAASTAVTVGINMDQLAAQIAAIETVTREAPENIGNGLKTLYARFSDIKMGETLDDGVDLGKVTSTLQKVGVQVLDAEGNMRQVGSIMEDLMSVWGNLDLTQRSSVATTLAGKFQLSRFTALMNRSDLYQEYLQGSENETGTEEFDKMQDIFESSMQGRLNKLQATIESIFTNAFETDSFYSLIDVLTTLIQTFADLTDAIGGGGAALTAFGAIATKVFSNNISRGLSNFVANRQRESLAKSNINSARTQANAMLSEQGVSLADSEAQQVVQQTAEGAQYAHLMNQEQLDKFNQSLERRTQILGALKQAEAEEQAAIEAAMNAFQKLGVGEEAAEQGLIGFIEMLNAAGTSITAADLQAVDFGKTLERVHGAQQQMTSLAGSLEKLAKVEKEVGAGSVEWDEALQKVQSKAGQLSNKLMQLNKNGELSEQSISRLNKVLKQLDNITHGDYESVEQLQQEFKQSQTSVNFLMESMQKLVTEGKITQEQFETLQLKTMGLREAFYATGLEAQTFNTQMVAQSKMNGITETISSLGQLAFSWQAFKSLGSLWADSDIENGKKIEETILNLAMNIPMLIFSFNQLKTTMNLPSIIQSFKDWRIASQAATEASEIATAAELKRAAAEQRLNTLIANHGQQARGAAGFEAMLANATEATAKAELNAAAATEARAAAMQQLKKAAIGNAVMMAATVGIMVATTAWDHYQKSVEKAKEAEKERLDAATENAKTTTDTINNWNKLYEEYKQTHVVSDELRKSTEELGDSLGIMGAKAAAASGDFKNLKESIDNAKDSAHKEAISAAQSLLEGKYGESLNGEEWFNGSAIDDYRSSLNKARGMITNETTNTIDGSISYDISYTNKYADILKQFSVEDGDTTAEAIGKAKAAIEELNKEAEKLDGTDQELEEARRTLNEFLQLEDVQAAQQAYETMFENRIEMTDFQEKIQATKGNIEELRELFENDQYTADYFNMLTSDAEKLQTITQSISGSMGEWVDSITAAADIYASNQQAIGEDYSNSFEEMIDFLENSDKLNSLSENARIKLLATIDFDQSKEEIEKAIEELNEEDLLELEIKANVESAKESISDVLEAFKEDEIVGTEQLNDMYLPEIVSAFEAASGKSEAFNDAMTLLADNTYNTQNAMIELDASLEDVEHSMALENLLEESAELADGFDAANAEARNLADTLEDDAFNLSIDIGGDLIDQADAMIEAIGDVGDATGKIGEGFLVAAEDAKALENAFPGILENYQVTADGMIQLDQEIAQSAMGVATSDMQSSSEAQAAKLNNYADYAQAMSENYMNEAVAMAEKAQLDVATEEEANKIIAASEEALEKTNIDLMQQHDLASMALAKNEVQYNEDAGASISDSFSQGVRFAQGALQALSNSAKTAAANIIGFFAGPVVNAISGAMVGKSVSEILTDAWVEQGVPSDAQMVGAEIRPGQEIKINGKNYTVGQGEGSVALAKKASEYQAKALALQRSAGQARAAAAGIQAKGLEGVDDVKSAGQPKEEKAKTEKTPKEKKEKEPEVEEAKRQSLQDAGNAELDIYKKIDTWINKLKNDYNKLKKIRDITWSKDRLKLMNQELGNLQSQYKAMQERIKISKEYQAVLTKASQNKKNQYGIETTLAELGLTDNNKNGVIDNYQEQWREANKKAKEWEAKADQYFKAHGGQVDQYGNLIKDSLMFEQERQDYQNLVDTAKNYYNIADKIKTVTDDYENTWKEIRDTEEKCLDLLLEMQDIQIEAYTKSLESLDTLQEMRDIMADMIGMWSGFELDSPFRGLVEDLQQVKDLFEDTEYNAAAYYDNIIKTLQEKRKTAAKELRANYDSAIKFYKQERTLAVNNQDGLGTGEIAQASRKLAEMQRWMDNPESVDNPYATYDEKNKKWIVNTEQLLADFTEQYKKVTSLALEAEKAWGTVQDNIVEALDDEAKKLDELYDKYDTLLDRYDREADRIKLIYGEEAYTDLAKLSESTGQLAITKAKEHQKEYEYWQKKQASIKEQEDKERMQRIAKAQELLDTARTKEEKANAKLLLEQANQYHSEEWEWYEDRMREAQQKVLDEQDRAAKAFKEAYGLAIKESEAQWLEAATGTRHAKYKLDDWNRDKERMTKYKDDFEREYEIEKLRYKWQNMLNNASDASLAIQKKIRTEGQNIVDQLANQVSMSEYDVKLANARLEILQKQIALEEAQQNKNQMKLQRDSQGNYKYVYAKDLDDIAQKRDELLDSIYDVYEMSKQHYIDSQTEYLNAVVEAGEKAVEIWTDASLTIEEKQKLIGDLVADTGEALDLTAEDVRDGYNGMLSALEAGVEAGNENVSKMAQDVLNTLKTQNEQAIKDIGIPWDNELNQKIQNISDVKKAFTTAMEDMRVSYGNFVKYINDNKIGIASVTGEAYGDAEAVINKVKQATSDLYNETLKLYTLFGIESEALEKAKQTLDQYRKSLDNATKGTGPLADQIRAANQSIITKAKESENWITKPTALEDIEEGKANPSAIKTSKVQNIVIKSVSDKTVGDLGDTSNSGVVESTATVTPIAAASYTPSGRSSGNNSGNVSAAKTSTTKGLYRATSSSGTVIGYWTDQSRAATEVLKYGNGVGSVDLVPMVYKTGYTVEGAAGKRAQRDNPLSSLLRFATGGYTGSWSDNGVDEKNGKWAILHQKELVLNAADTKNILAAVDLVRQMTDTLKTASLETTFNKYGKAQPQQDITDTIEQRVAITAEFPNANSANEIKQALLSLSDSAMQYAYRER